MSPQNLKMDDQSNDGNLKGNRDNKGIFKLILDVPYTICYTTGLFTKKVVVRLCEVVGYPYYKFNISVVNIFHSIIGRHEALCLSREYRGDISIGRALIRLVTNIGKTFVNVGRAFMKRGPIAGFATLFVAIGNGIKNTWIHNKARVNFLAPVLAAVGFVIVVIHMTNINVGLSITYKGQTLGIVKSESEFTDAVLDIENRIASVTGSNFTIKDVPKYALVISPKSNILTVDEIRKDILKANNQIINASGLYIDGKLYAANTDGDGIQQILNDILAENSTNTPDEKVEFVKKIDIKKDLYTIDCIKSLDQIKTDLTSSETAQKTYVTVKGDAPSLISQKFHMKLSALYTLNPDMKEKGIKVGEEVIITKAQPMLGIAVSKQIKYNENIDPPVTETTSNQLYEKQSQVKVEGKPGVLEVTAAVKIVDGVEIERNVLQKVEVVHPVSKVVVKGTKPVPTTKASGIFLRPVNTGYYSSPFGYRTWGRGSSEFHKGLDIACDMGTPIMAADGGTVIFASYSGGLGLHVIIDHGNGYVTKYGHTSKVLVKVGDKVFKGQVIAKSGMSGRATGPHVHFQVEYHGQVQNPAKLIQ